MIKQLAFFFLLSLFLFVNMSGVFAQGGVIDQFPRLKQDLQNRNAPLGSGNDDSKMKLPNFPWTKDMKIQRFLRDYFKTQPVYLVPRRIQEMVDLGYFDQKPTSLSYSIGFFAEIFKQNPDKVLGWVRGLKVTQYQAGALVRAMRHAGMQDEVMAWLVTKDKWSYRGNPTFHNLVPVGDIIANELEDLEIIIGAYAASGHPVYIRRFAEAFSIYPQYPDHEAKVDPVKAKSVIVNRALQEITLLVLYAYPEAKAQMENIVDTQPQNTRRELNRLFKKLDTYQGTSTEFQGLPQSNFFQGR